MCVTVGTLDVHAEQIVLASRFYSESKKITNSLILTFTLTNFAEKLGVGVKGNDKLTLFHPPS